jgi:large subunit ribosomal protein L1
MAQLTKNQKALAGRYDFQKQYPLEEAVEIVKNITYTKFDASVDMSVHLGVDPKKADQMVRGTIVLPHGIGKVKRILVLCTPEKENEAKTAGADYVGLDDYLKKIEDGWTDVDIIITMPEVMAKVGKLGKVLGPRGLMPNPKTGTVTTEIGKAVKDIKSGKIEFKVDKYGIVHASIGRVSFSKEALRDNAKELLSALLKAKPASAKGNYLKNISLSSTMSRGVDVDINTNFAS